MKKSTILNIIAIAILSVYSVSVKANINKNIDSIALQSATKSNDSSDLQLRLNTINQMDKSTLNKEEIKGLVSEVKKIEKQIKKTDGGLYISAGALIVILILLIILI